MKEIRTEIKSGCMFSYPGYWIRISKPKIKFEDLSQITGKFLFFSKDRKLLIEKAVSEIVNYGFLHAKVNEKLLDKNEEYVLCLYDADDSRKYELAERSKNEKGINYRWWKSDEDGKPYTWNRAYDEIKADTELGKKILNKLIELGIIVSGE